MSRKPYNISLALGLNQGYDHKVAVGIIKFSRTRADWRLYGNEWLFQPSRFHHENPPDGIIARVTAKSDLKRLYSYGVPVVDVAGSYDDARLHQAVNDDRLTGNMAGEHLVSRGFQHFAYVGIDEAAWSRKRKDGLRDAVRPVSLEGLFSLSVGISWLKREYSLAALARWLRKLPRPCGVVAANDLIGYRVSVAARMAGLAVPEELAIIGVDNEETYCELSMPPLTSIACDCGKIGWEAASLLAQLLNREKPPRRVVVEPLGVVAKDSTNIVLGEDVLVRGIKRFIRAHAAEGINVADVTGTFPMSRRALEKRFKGSEGRTIHAEILAVRLDKAVVALEEGRTATQAAFESGFSTVQHFYHAFRQRHGTTPLAYASSAKRVRAAFPKT